MKLVIDCSMEEMETFLERIRQPTPVVESETNGTSKTYQVQVLQASIAALVHAIKLGQKIPAIKEARQLFPGMGLHEAKIYVEKFIP